MSDEGAFGEMCIRDSFSDLPVKYEGKELNISSMTLCQHKSKMAMLFDQENGRFLLVNTDYDWSADYFGDRAGEIFSFPGKDGLNDWKGYEILSSKFIKPFYSFESDYTYCCIMKNPSGGLEAVSYTHLADKRIRSRDSFECRWRV